MKFNYLQVKKYIEIQYFRFGSKK